MVHECIIGLCVMVLIVIFVGAPRIMAFQPHIIKFDGDQCLIQTGPKGWEWEREYIRDAIEMYPDLADELKKHLEKK